jgi:hypothetical protein
MTVRRGIIFSSALSLVSLFGAADSLQKDAFDTLRL